MPDAPGRFYGLSVSARNPWQALDAVSPFPHSRVTFRLRSDASTAIAPGWSGKCNDGEG